jgi:hypothetical protein
MKNGQIWQDVDGNDIQAHGGCILEHEGSYYWYGENKGAPNVPGTRRVEPIGISCYRSNDLLHWHYEGIVLTPCAEVMERPKVLYNAKTKKFIMWLHLDRKDYTLAAAGMATADCPTGPFTVQSSGKPLWPVWLDYRDLTLYEENGHAWLIHTKDCNRTMTIARLDDTYEHLTAEHHNIFIDQDREAPALFRHNNCYYMLSSGCTGWEPNPMLYATASHIYGQWKLIDNPTDSRTTYDGQSAHVFFAKGQPYLLLDHWQPYDLQHSGYSILPIRFNSPAKAGLPMQLYIPWHEEWKGIEP